MRQHSTKLLLQAHLHIIAKQKWYKLPMTEKCHHFNTAKRSSNIDLMKIPPFAISQSSKKSIMIKEHNAEIHKQLI